MVETSGPNAMALEMARWLLTWSRTHPAEWDGLDDIFTCLWNISRCQFVDNRTNGILPITMAAVTLARDTADEVHPSLIRLTKHVGDFYSPPETRPRPFMEIFSGWTNVRLETWVETAARSIHVVRGLRRGAHLTNAWPMEFMFETLCAYLEDAHLIGRTAVVKRNRQVAAIGNAMMALATQDPDDLRLARRRLEFESP